MKRRILLVEDEDSLVMTLRDRLTADGYEVEVRQDGAEGFQSAREQHFDLLILDVALPGRNGLDVCRDLRKEQVETPILMLTARGQTVDKVLGLKLGADDYMTKPFDMMELQARIEALLRRGRDRNTSLDTVTFGSVRVDFSRAVVTRAGEEVTLSALELRLLRYLVERRGVVLSRDELLEKVWGYGATPVTRTVDVHIGSLRQKLENNPARPAHILTVHGLGYKFTA